MLNEIKKEIISFIKKDERILSCYIFGSVANGTARPDSDIDIAIMPYGNLKLSAMDKFNIGNKLAVLLNKTVDIGIISTKNLIYSREALLKGVNVFTRNSDESELIRATILGLYIQFNYDRREVINAYRC